jgi:hypothetical protein
MLNYILQIVFSTGFSGKLKTSIGSVFKIQNDQLKAMYGLVFGLQH